MITLGDVKKEDPARYRDFVNELRRRGIEPVDSLTLTDIIEKTQQADAKAAMDIAAAANKKRQYR